MNEVVGDLIKMIRRLIGEHIELVFLPGPALGAVHADRGQLGQVLMNLCVNSRDAMPQGGRLSIRDPAGRARPRVLRRSRLGQARGVCVSGRHGHRVRHGREHDGSHF